ncbi:MAG TPA: DivIVA domain-containing protein [Ilumatobacteraceae bacterium]|nr:DivIVA domain-containing protein [Ilumatobacteraceae bacterium]
MEMSPQQVRNASFKSAKRGFDPDEVQAFLREVAESLEAAQNQSTAMEARARAAVARLQEVSTARESAEPASSGDAETISRTLLLAQRTADSTVAEAKSEADRIITAAHEEAATTIDSTREMSARLLDEARSEARAVSEVELKAAKSEVEALLARRDFLESDVDQLEHFLVDQRDRLRQAASALLDISERVPGGLGDVRRPLLSASDDPTLPLESRTPAYTGSEIATEAGPDPAVEPSPPPSSSRVADPTPDAVDDLSVHVQAAPNDPVDEEPAATTAWAADPGEEPQFRFGIGETRRSE